MVNKNQELLDRYISSCSSKALTDEDHEHDSKMHIKRHKTKSRKKTRLQKLNDNLNTDWSSLLTRCLKRLIINPESSGHILWRFIGMLFALIESVLYPFCMAQGFPDDLSHPIFILIICSAIYFAVDIPLNFIIAVKKEGEKDEYVHDLTYIKQVYMHGDFSQDMLLTLPLGFIGGAFISQLEILHIVKVFRLKTISDVLSPPFYMPMIRSYYHKKLMAVLQHDRKKNDICQSNNQIIPRLKAQNMMHSLRIGFFIIGGVYLCGILWFELVNRYIYTEDETNFVNTYF